jgi:nucleotide-binding universal stress UspA family protein
MIGLLAQEHGVDIEYQAMRGDPAIVISKLAENENVDLVVVGNRGIKGIKRLFIESVSSKVVQNSNRSILVVKS